MFRCPQCRVPLERQTAPGLGVFWRCRECGGRAATFGLLRRVVSRTAVDELWRNARGKRKRGGRSCPACELRMVETGVPSSRGGEVVDVCLLCHFAWFDRRELESLPPPDGTADPEDENGVFSGEVRQTQISRAIAEAKIAAIAERQDESFAGDLASAPETPVDWIVSVFGLPTVDQRAVVNQPLATFFTAVALALFGIATIAVGLEPMSRVLGLVPARWTEGFGITLLSSFFVHAGPLHFFTNVYFLLITGPGAEDALGHGKLVALLFLALVAGGAAHILVDPSSAVPCVGASGAISGVMAFFALKYPLAKIDLFLRLYPLLAFPGRIRIPAIAAFVLWIVVQIFTLDSQIHGQSDVSAAAHLGGVVVGVLFWLRYRKS